MMETSSTSSVTESLMPCPSAGSIQTSSSAAMLPNLLVRFMMSPRLISRKEPWALPNIKKFFNLGYVKLGDLAKFCAAYLETQGDDSVFVEPTFIDSSADDTPKVEDDSVLLDKHYGFALNPKKLIKEFQQKPGDPKAQSNLFHHYTNHTYTANCVLSGTEKNNGRLIDLDTT